MSDSKICDVYSIGLFSFVFSLHIIYKYFKKELKQLKD